MQKSVSEPLLNLDGLQERKTTTVSLKQKTETTFCTRAPKLDNRRLKKFEKTLPGLIWYNQHERVKLDLRGDCLFKPLMLCVSGSYLAIGSDTGA